MQNPDRRSFIEQIETRKPVLFRKPQFRRKKKTFVMVHERTQGIKAFFPTQFEG